MGSRHLGIDLQNLTQMKQETIRAANCSIIKSLVARSMDLIRRANHSHRNHLRVAPRKRPYQLRVNLYLRPYLVTEIQAHLETLVEPKSAEVVTALDTISSRTAGPHEISRTAP